MMTKTAIVFSGGGSLSAVQVGMLRALVEANLRFDQVVGASVGAINGPTLPQCPIQMALRRLLVSGALRKTDIFPLSWLDTYKLRGLLLQPTALNRLLDQVLPIHCIKEAKLPLYIVTTDLFSGAETVCMRPAKSSIQPRKTKTRRALKFKWAPVLAYEARLYKASRAVLSTS